MIGLIFGLILNNFLAPIDRSDPLVVSMLVEKRLILNVDSSELLPLRLKNLSLGVKTTAKSFVVIDVATDKILLEKNSNEQLPIASLTKLMTALVFWDTNPNLDQVVTIREEDDRAPAKIKVFPGDEIAVADLYYSALVGSTNNAMAALVRSTGLGEQEFVARMNKKAAELGLNNTIFIEPTGLNSNNLSTTEDIVRLLAEAFKNKKIEEALKLDHYEFGLRNRRSKQIVWNTNELLNSYLSISGGKTGYIKEAGYNLAVKIKGEKGQEIIIALLGCASSFDRFKEAKGLATWTFENYRW
jgi:D-alanyl-D-alanine carboxypeptidase